ncbi:hypothetical protein BDZ89DRAFT_1259250 [Hymenopellis radicata]|nr:hypothetical protein BDZ89DRAFT_1259250 [Hymenopellis radicata]
MDADIGYMKRQIVAKPEYAAFKALRHHVVPNPSIAEHWSFVNRRIFRRTISHAIGIEPTWLREIEEGHHLLQAHIGDPAVQRHLGDTESHGGSKGICEISHSSTSMGVPGLWSILDKHAQATTLLEATLSLGFTPNAGGQRALRLGIDVKRLFQLAIIPLFVFDGPERPPMKRDQAVKSHLLPHELAFQNGVEPRPALKNREAEAELAALSRAGVVDAVLSTDVDCLVFGATRVFRIDLNESDPGLTRDPSGEYSRLEEPTRDPYFTRPALTCESNESSQREFRVNSRIKTPPNPFMHDEHPRAMARGHSAVHDAGLRVGWWLEGDRDGGGGGGEEEPNRDTVVGTKEEKTHLHVVLDARLSIQPPPPLPSSSRVLSAYHILVSSSLPVIASSESSSAAVAKTAAAGPAQSRGPDAHPGGCLTVVSAAGVTIVTPQAVAVVVAGPRVLGGRRLLLSRRQQQTWPKARAKRHPTGRLTIVRAAEATIVALWVVVVVSDRVLATSTRASKAVLAILIYSTATLEENSLSQANLTLIALMSGGDYHHGITNCGIATAVDVVTHTDLGPRLIDAVNNLRPKELPKFLIQWRQQLCTLLRDNPNHVLSQRHPAMAAAIPASFPNPRIIRLYVDPKISPINVGNSLEWNAPSIPQLSLFLEKHFRWGWPGGVLDDFKTHIVAGLALRELIRDTLVDDGEVVESHIAPYSLITRPDEKRRCPRSELEMRILLTISAALVDAVKSARQDLPAANAQVV